MPVAFETANLQAEVDSLYEENARLHDVIDSIRALLEDEQEKHRLLQEYLKTII